jgi:4-diphosphocytidyl-2-C-methyl-D-erythritol kinase
MNNTAWTWASAWPAPAKINLFLHVVGRRPDGYHLLQTAFHFLDHGDTLHFAPRSDSNIHLLTPLPGVPPESDLTVRAARLLQAETGCTEGADIRVAKRLPLGGGLGGGSSDAATVLLALNHLWGTGVSRQRLQEIGLSLGADVPIFVYGHSAFAEGVGEALRPITPPPRHYLVIEPGVGVPTAAIFGAPELRRDTPVIDPTQWQPAVGANDLEPVACARFPAVAQALAELRRVAPDVPVRMSGSGACVFAEFASVDEAQAASRRLPADLRRWSAAGLSEHPCPAWK